MSTEEKPLPDFAQIPTPLPSRRSKANGIPRAPVAAPSSAFSIIETDEVSRTLDFGMSEEDLEDVSDGEGSSSDLHDSLRARHESSVSVEDNFESLSSDYSSGVREEDTYRKPVAISEDVPDFELPPLETAVISEPVEPVMKRPRNRQPAPALQRPRNTQSLPDFSKFDEVEEVAKPIVEEEVVEAKSKISPKLLMMIVAVVVVVVIATVVVLFVLPGISSPAVIAPVVAQFGHLLQ